MLFPLMLCSALLLTPASALAFSIQEVPLSTDAPLQVEVAPPEKPLYLAVLIDDMGHSIASNKAAFALPGDISFAFLPYAKHTATMVSIAKALDRDILLHAPMENIRNFPLGPGGMTADMNEQDFKAALNQGINAVGHAVGVNNHTGSKLTALEQQMRWTMEVLIERGLFFIDSQTTAKSVAWKLARDAGMGGVKRDVFLDHVLSAQAIDRQFNLAIQRAKSQGSAVLIAHPHRISLQYLKNNLSKLKHYGIELVKISQLEWQAKQKELALKQP